MKNLKMISLLGLLSINFATASSGYDMRGNVDEWVQDLYTKSPTGSFDPVGPSTGASSLRVQPIAATLPRPLEASLWASVL